MNNRYFWALLLLVGLFNSCVLTQMEETTRLTDYVNPYIGTGKHGHVFVGANVPFGLVQLGPTSIPQQWDWTSGYHYSDSTVIGFPHTHLSGTGIGDLHDVTLMPVVGPVKYARGHETDPESGLWSYADRQREVCRPGYYATHLLRYGVDVELTCTPRVGFHKYVFPTTQETAVVIDLENGGGWDNTTEALVQRVDSCRLEGYRYSKGWANDQRIYFAVEFSRPMTALEGVADRVAVHDTLSGEVVYARANMDLEEGEPLYVKVALSPTSVDNAWKNLLAELPGWDFDATVAQAEERWEEALGKIVIQTPDEEVKRKFYTAMYHTMVAPSVFCDVNGDYRGADGKIYRGADFVNLTTFSCWDTYRALHPLMTLIHPEQIRHVVETFLHIYEQQGKLPVWHLMGCETNCMVGNPGVCILADAMMKDFVVDEEAAYAALKHSVMLDERGQQYRKEYGYLPYDKMKESVAYDMEYAIADWAVAQVARKLGKMEDYAYFNERSRSYRQLFDPATHFVRGRSSEGVFHAPFNPYASDHRNDDYCEGNAWQYTFLAPHDFEGLVECFGGKAALVAKLDSLFEVKSELEGKDKSPDISGMIGQYAHGNEPSHHITYFYTLAGEPEKTADRVRQVLTELYGVGEDGLCGNEDVGAMSAWYILSALGFYQVEPAGGRYVFGSPLVDEAVLKVRDGEFRIVVHHNSPEHKYIRKVSLNGVPYTKRWIDFEDIVSGGEMEVWME